ncbi:MAG: hypothetical protein JWQ27_2692 [Ferruginibacter sp.]|nr:hypothetical protein [Ferruginibacter sp.]
MKLKDFLMLLSFLITQVAVGQEISKPDIVKYKIKSISTIDGDGKIKYT